MTSDGSVFEGIFVFLKSKKVLRVPYLGLGTGGSNQELLRLKNGFASN